jgi:hypothetical protein
VPTIVVTTSTKGVKGDRADKFRPQTNPSNEWKRDGWDEKTKSMQLYETRYKMYIVYIGM